MWLQKNSSLNGIQTHSLCNTGAAVLYQPSFPANLGLVNLGVCYKLVDDEDKASMYMTYDSIELLEEDVPVLYERSYLQLWMQLRQLQNKAWK